MCNDFGNEAAYAEYAEAFRQLSMPIKAPPAPPNLEPRSDIWPPEIAPTFRRYGEGVELARLRWGLPPSSAKPGRSSILDQKDGVLPESRRCIVPASHFFEFTETKSSKEKYQFTPTYESWFFFAGPWQPASGREEGSFTPLTTTPGPEVAPTHNRQMLLLRRDRSKAALDLTAPEAEPLAPLPSGCLAVKRVR